MIKSKIHNDIFVKKVTNITSLFEWSNALEQGFPQLPEKSIVVNDTLVNQYAGFHDKAYMHHSTIGSKFGKLFFAHTIHDYDEDAGGKYVSLSVSSDKGVTWTVLSPIMPQMSNMVAWSVVPAKWSYPSSFIDVPSGYYLLINAVETVNYTPIGTLVRKINTDNTYGDILWVNNSINESSRVVPAPETGYPSYAFASEEIIEEVKTFINQPINKPKILFGWSQIWQTQGTYSGNNLREPTVVQPYNYKEWLKVWRVVGLDYNVVQNGENTATQVISEIPNKSSTTAKRFYNYSPEIIVSVGHSKAPDRTELMLFIARKNNQTGQYVVHNNDVYSVTPITKSAPLYVGKYKEGGEQLPYILREGKNLLHIGFSVSKEQIYFKTIDISSLI